ncbi:collagen alpha-1(VI) chain-like isoform X2 [Pithys albifrons albifrons]|uniref:collagen alpha-1(VI) chain-like isoform X2 n=1 Tax=Pithys albifrons albifrons TaxID=3385563 RepID=UPI003A5D0AA8
MAARTTIKLASVGPLGSDRRVPACLIPSLPPLAKPSPRGLPALGRDRGGSAAAEDRGRQAVTGAGSPDRRRGGHRQDPAPGARSFRSARPGPPCTRCRPCIAAVSPRAAHGDRAGPPPERHRGRAGPRAGPGSDGRGGTRETVLLLLGRVRSRGSKS